MVDHRIDHFCVSLSFTSPRGEREEKEEEEIVKFSRCFIYIQVFDNGQQLYFDYSP